MKLYKKVINIAVILTMSLFIFSTNTYASTLSHIVDPTFNTGGSGFTSDVWDVEIQPDGKYMVGGWYTTFNDQPSNRITRLNADGTVDTSFNSGTGFNRDVYDIEMQTDGKYIVVGDFRTYNAVSQVRIARLKSDGSLDNTFVSGTGFDALVWDVEIQSDGKYIVVGEFNNYNGVPASKIARLNSDGSLDTTFNIGSGLDSLGHIEDVEIQSDGKIMIGGTFTSYNGAVSNDIARLNADGTLDTSFSSGSGFDAQGVYDLEVQSDGKYIVGGNFFTYQGQPQRSLIRLNSNGTKDTTFDVGTGVSGGVYDVDILPTGKYIITGTFNYFNNVMVSYSLAQINIDGSLDQTFGAGFGIGGVGRELEYEPCTNDIIVAGTFSEYDKVSVPWGMIRIIPANASDIKSPQVIVNDTKSITVGDSVIIDALSNDTDTDSDILSISNVKILSGDTTGQVSIVDNKIVFNSSSSYIGNTTFSYTVKDTLGCAVKGSVSVNADKEVPKEENNSGNSNGTANNNSDVNGENNSNNTLPFTGDNLGFLTLLSITFLVAGSSIFIKYKRSNLL